MPRKKQTGGQQNEFKVVKHRDVEDSDHVRDPATGVAVTPYRTNMGTREQAAKRDLFLVVTNENGVVTERVQVMDVLDSMLDKGLIDRRQHGAGKEFKAAYDMAHKGLYQSINPVSAGRSGYGSDPMLLRVALSEQLHRLYAILGGHDRHVCRVLRLVVGEGRGISDMVRDYGFSWNDWRGLLLGGLDILAGHFYATGGNRKNI